MIEIKPGVKTVGMTPQLGLALITAGWIYSRYQDVPMVITAVTDGKHKRQSAHNSGRAADLRIWTLVDKVSKPEDFAKAREIATKVAAEISKLLGDDYDCFAENDHIHLEWDPK